MGKVLAKSKASAGGKCKFKIKHVLRDGTCLGTKKQISEQWLAALFALLPTSCRCSPMASLAIKATCTLSIQWSC